LAGTVQKAREVAEYVKCGDSYVSKLQLARWIEISNYYVNLFILLFKLADFNNCFKILLAYNFKMYGKIEVMYV